MLEPRRQHETATFEPPVVSEVAQGSLVGAQQPEGDLEHQEHVNDVLRLRKLMNLAVWIYPGFGLIDWLVTAYLQAGRLWWLLTLRGVGALAVAASFWRIHRPPMPSPRTFALVQHGLFTIGGATVALMCVEYGGIDSPYATGLMLFVLARGAIIMRPFRRGMLELAITALMFPVVVLLAAPFSPHIAAQLRDSAALAGFGQAMAFIVATWVIVAWAGDIMWTVRRQLYEARTIGRYRLRRRLGMGGMGEVWAAYHPALKREVAIKVLRTDPGTRATVARFEREVKATAELSHPNTVRIFDYGVTEDGIRYYVMELLDGCDLAQLVRRDGPLDAARATHIVAQAARAVAEAHGRDIIHRDLKPENLLVAALGGERDFVKVVDFGIAKLKHDDTATLTQGGWIGTPAYMAPESARGQPADARSDVYSLGAVLFFCLTGRPPFIGQDAAEVLRAHLDAEAPAPSTVLGKPLPAGLDAIVLRCLAKQPEARYASAAALATALGSQALAPGPAVAQA